MDVKQTQEDVMGFEKVKVLIRSYHHRRLCRCNAFWAGYQECGCANFLPKLFLVISLHKVIEITKFVRPPLSPQMPLIAFLFPGGGQAAVLQPLARRSGPDLFSDAAQLLQPKPDPQV